MQEFNSKEIIKEGKHINLSLHYLEQVIISLRAGQIHAAKQLKEKSSPKTIAAATPYHIPYRNSVLTSILRDSLGGNCRSCFLFTVTTDIRQFEETISTCR